MQNKLRRFALALSMATILALSLFFGLGQSPVLSRTAVATPRPLRHPTDTPCTCPGSPGPTPGSQREDPAAASATSASITLVARPATSVTAWITPTTCRNFAKVQVDAQRFPDPEEQFTFTARVVNQGAMVASTHHERTLGSWTAGEQAAMACCPHWGREQNTTWTWNWAWRSGAYTVTLHIEEAAHGIDDCQQHTRPPHRRPLSGNVRPSLFRAGLLRLPKSGRHIFLSRLVAGAVCAIESAHDRLLFTRIRPMASPTASALI